MLPTLALLLGEENSIPTKGKGKMSVEYLINVHRHQEYKRASQKERKNGSSYLKGCMELYISWDWETGRPPLSPS